MTNVNQYLPLLRIIEDIEVLKIGNILKIGNTLVSSQRGAYDTPKKITAAFLNMYRTWSELKDNADKRGCRFCDLDIIEKEASFFIQVADHYERSPASKDIQKEFMKRGFLVLTNPQPWQLIQEIIVLKRHVSTIYDLTPLEHTNLFQCALGCWERYAALKNELQQNAMMSLKESWLTFFTNDRLGATILHAHSQPGLSLLPPGKETRREFLTQESCTFAETEDFVVSTIPGRNNEVVVYSKKAYTLDKLDKTAISKQLGLIRTVMLKIYHDMFGGKMPINEGMFLAMQPSLLVYVLVPYFNEGAPQRLMNLQYYSGTPKETAQNMAIKLQQLDEWKMFKNQGLKLTMTI